MPAEIIAIANHKGGVTKSTTAVSLAAGLAHAQWRTLLVDCDAQGNSTSMFIEEPDDWNDDDGEQDAVAHDLYDVIGTSLPAEQAIVTTRVTGLDLLPATLAVARLDQELMPMHKREEQLRRHLTPILDRYDAVILDLAPNLGPMVITALCAADSLIVPTDASRWGLRGVQMFLGWADDLRAAEVLTADLLGVLLTKVEPGTRISRLIHERLQASGLPLFDTVVPKRTAAERMVDERALIGDRNADPDLTAAYAEFTREVVERVVAAQEQRGRHARGA